MDPSLQPVSTGLPLEGKKKKQQIQRVIQDLADFSLSSDDESINPEYPATSRWNENNDSARQKCGQREESLCKDICSTMLGNYQTSQITAEEKHYKNRSAVVTSKLKHKDFLNSILSQGKESVLTSNVTCAREKKNPSKHNYCQGLNKAKQDDECRMVLEPDPDSKHFGLTRPQVGCRIKAVNLTATVRALVGNQTDKAMKITGCVQTLGKKGTPDSALQPKHKPKSRKGKFSQNKTLANLGINFDFSDDSDNDVHKNQVQVNDLPPLMTPSLSNDNISCNTMRHDEFNSNTEYMKERPNDMPSVESEQSKKLTSECDRYSQRKLNITSFNKDLTSRKIAQFSNGGLVLKSEKEAANDLPCVTRTSTPLHSETKQRESSRYDLSVSEIHAREKQCVPNNSNETEINLKETKWVFPTKTTYVSNDAGLAEESILPFLESMQADMLESTSCDSKQNFRLYLAIEQSKANPCEHSKQDNHSKDKNNFFLRSEEYSSGSLPKTDNESPQNIESTGCVHEKDKLQEDEPSHFTNILEPNTSILSEELQFQTAEEELKSKTESQYETCLLSEEEVSFYETVDVSVQTSFICETVKSEDAMKHVDQVDFMEESTHGSDDCTKKCSNSCEMKQTQNPVFNLSDICSNHSSDVGRAGHSLCCEHSKQDFWTNDKDVRKLSSHEKIHGETLQEDPKASRKNDSSSQELSSSEWLGSDSNYFTQNGIDVSGVSDVLKKECDRSKCSLGSILLHGIESPSDSRINEQVTAADTISSTQSCKTDEEVTEDIFLPSMVDKENFENMRTTSHDWRQRINVSSDEDADELLEAFFKKNRSQMQQVADEDNDVDDDMDNFIVNDSDLSESEEEFHGYLTHKLDFADRVPGKSALVSKENLGDCSYSDVFKSSDSEDDSSKEYTDKDTDTSSDECSDTFSTPLPVKKKSWSKTSSDEGSSQWFTPSTSIKSKSKDFSNANAGAESTVASILAAQNTTNNRIGASSASIVRHLTFLQSLNAETPDSLCHPEARSFVSQFRKRREELSSRLFKLFNSTVFENKLPENMQIMWNKRLLKTAGRCRQKRVGGKHHACIELSLKVCDTAERVRDTLIHEMCHAAVWLVHEKNEGHGPLWRYWASRASKSHPEIPLIGRCHDYKISTKFIYKCDKCGQQIGRHSKSLDTKRFICGRCGGHFQVFLASVPKGVTNPGQTPRTPGRFALFVKEHYGIIKKQNKGISHKEIMNILSKDFSEKNKI